MERTINSHIQIPRFILEYFTDSKNSLHQLDVKTMRISLGHARTMNTKKGYYSNETEKLMNILSETPFAKLLAEIVQIDFGSSVYELPESFEKDVKSFFALLAARGPYMYDMIKKNSLYLHLFPIKDEEKPDFSVREIMSNEHHKVFDGYSVVLAENRSDISFVLPMCAFYSIQLWKKDALVFPATPNYAFILLPNDAVHHMQNNDIRKILLLDTESFVRTFNLTAFRQQKQYNYHDYLGYGWVVSNNRQTLEYLVEDIKKNSSGFK